MHPLDPKERQRQLVSQAAEVNWQRFRAFVTARLPPAALAGEGASAVLQSALVRVLAGIEAGGVRATSAQEMEKLLWVILRRRCIDRLRTRAPGTTLPLDVEVVAVAQARDNDLGAIQEELAAFLARLEEVDQRILALVQHGHSDGEIAPMVGLGHPDRVRRRRTRALNALRLAYLTCLDPDCPDGSLPRPLPPRCPHCGRAWERKDHDLALHLLRAAKEGGHVPGPGNP